MRYYDELSYKANGEDPEIDGRSIESFLSSCSEENRRRIEIETMAIDPMEKR
jgi:hypothetical protein